MKMSRKSTATRQAQANNPFQMVWWKPVLDMQREMARSFTNGLNEATLDNVISAQKTLFDKLENNVSNVFGEAFNNQQMLSPWLLGEQTEPYIDIIENKNTYKIKAELPGVKEKDINIDFADEGIQIEGEKYEEAAEKGENYRHQECHAGYFSRTIALPEDADIENAKTHFNLNILTIEVPKKTKEKKAKNRNEDKKDRSSKDKKSS